MCKEEKDNHPDEASLNKSEQAGKADNRRSNFFSEDYCAALDNSNVPIYIIDPESFEVLFCNCAAGENLDHDHAKLPCYKRFMCRESPCENCAALRIYRDGNSSPVEIYNPDGSWGLAYASLLHWKGRVLVQITWIDITDRKAIEAELRLNSKEYSAVARQSTSGIMRYDIATGTAAVNVDSQLNRVAEYTVKNYVQVIRDSGMIVPESRPTARAMFQDICSGTPSKGYDLLLTLAQGEKRWCHLDYALIEDEQGNPYRAVVSFYDNTEKRERELAYQKWNSRLNTLMNEYTAYVEVNLSQDMVEAEGKSGSWNQVVGSQRYTDFVHNMGFDEVFVDDRLNFQRYFNRERLLGQFYEGNHESSLEYRILTEEGPQWFRAELQMVSDPTSNDVKTFIMFSNVDIDLREKKRLKSEAEQDLMTGLYNHATAESLMEQALSQNTGAGCCFLVADLDDLRDINSFLGHPEGDRALKAIASSMRAHFGETAILARSGGDEFIALLQNVSESKLHHLLSNFIQSLNETFIGPLNEKPIHVSVGAAMGTIGTEDFKTLYERADLALFYTKAMGKNAYHLYKPEMEKRDFSYQPRSAAFLRNLNWLNSSEVRKLLQAMAAFFPLVISVNLTRNTYYMLEYTAYTPQKALNEGSYDQLMENGMPTFHPDDREGFLNCFGRKNLLQAYAEGKRTIEHTCRQMGEDGLYHHVKTVSIFIEDEHTGDICVVSFTHILSDQDGSTTIFS